ncbi:MAG: hypothetical protein CMJ19_02685 [Phycisphaeraceae bacterium]|nr:hypothetical protein [Phycisphaeraceae bacterium]|tara:strand:+ start:311 stop:514 length:204 start_codon:yes stop_codon:yes gene_type:complete
MATDWGKLAFFAKSAKMTPQLVFRNPIAAFGAIQVVQTIKIFSVWKLIGRDANTDIGRNEAIRVRHS